MTSSADIDSLLTRMASDLTSLIKQRHTEFPVMIGIQTGGVWLAQRLHEMLKITEPLGRLDISFYRDDFTRMGMNPQVKPSHIPFDLDGRDIILVDDVLHTGRTIRAALNEIFDYGRPHSITLAVLFERSGRELPIEAAIVGQHLKLTGEQHVKLTGPEPLGLTVQAA